MTHILCSFSRNYTHKKKLLKEWTTKNGSSPDPRALAESAARSAALNAAAGGYHTPADFLYNVPHVPSPYIKDEPASALRSAAADYHSYHGHAAYAAAYQEAAAASAVGLGLPYAAAAHHMVAATAPSPVRDVVPHVSEL